ncbi:unnamed protein product [Prunus armeniaca]|uniref:Uncharacterized protein n=1 Tax=Prunus armeniaca TaxID=36596 RepID=A0A6J5VCG1_PRUAR|nr:unnamed protein product [Prunus armeniaca]
MDNVSSLDCLQLDSQSEVLDKDAAMVPLNCDTPIIGSKTEESEDEESMDWKSEDEESEDWKSRVEELEDEKSKDGKSYGECKYCLKVDKHPTQLCSYSYRVPKNAIVGESCVVACLVCGCLFRDSCCADCSVSIGHALLKDCTICGKKEEHSNFECPEREEKRKNSGFTYDPYTGSFSVEIRPLK